MASYLIGRMIYWATGTPAAHNVRENPEPYTSRPCRFRLDDTSSATFTLPNGRKVGYAEYGTPSSGSPKHVVFALHGLPGQRLEGAFADDIAKELSVRVIVPERPGYGLSDANPGYTVLSHAKDVLSLADHLGVAKFGIIGTSGGGPYSMACAYLFPRDRLLSVTNVVGMGETSTMSSKGMAWLHWLGYGPVGYMRFARATTHWWVTGFFKLTEPITRMGLSDEERVRVLVDGWEAAYKAGKLPAAEMECWNKLGTDYAHDVLRVVANGAKEIWSTAKGCQAVTMDGANLASPWGFKVQDIRPDLRVQLWYGRQDVNCPASHGLATMERLEMRGEGIGRETSTLHVEDETHMSIQMKYHDDIWKELIHSMAVAER